MIKNGSKQKTVLKRLLAGLLAAGAAFIFCACELPGGEISYDGKDGGVYHAHIPAPEEIIPEPVEITDPGYTESFESSVMNFVVPNDFDKMEYFSREDFRTKNPEVTYSNEELITVSEAYFSYMEKFIETGWQIKFSFAFITNDNLPELIYTSEAGESQILFVEFHICTYDFNKNEVVEIGSYYSQYGMGLYYVERENILWYSEWGKNEWIHYDYYITINQEYKFELVGSFEADVSTTDPDKTARVNHVDTDYDTLLEYQDCFAFVSMDGIEIESYFANAMIPLEGDFVFINDEYDYENYYRQYEKIYLDAMSDKYAETLPQIRVDYEYKFVYMDGDNIPDLFVKKNDKLCFYNNSVYYDSYNQTVNAYVNPLYKAEFAGEVSYSEYYRVVHEHIDENGKTTDNYYLMDRYNFYVVMRLISENGNYIVNDCPVTKERYDKISGSMSNYTFTDVTEDDLCSDTDENSIKKHFKEALSKYDP
ncbi:MAG: hypothetical protein IKS60_02740 [Lachnospiraceae bacterium]|nr:hypothetical protein [Lachnospiraceae bacterium]